jgi:hypothetical protein
MLPACKMKIERIKKMNKILNLHGKSNESIRQLIDGGAMYVGRTSEYYGLKGSPLNNTVYLDPKANLKKRLANISQYRIWLWGKMKSHDKAVLEELKKIGPDTTLMCWCFPLPCHSEVVAKAAEWLRGQK